jgi:hypothetical protein
MLREEGVLSALGIREGRLPSVGTNVVGCG